MQILKYPHLIQIYAACDGLTSLTREEIRTLLSSVSQHYVITDDGNVFHDATEHNAYLEFLPEYYWRDPPSSVWLTTVPCAQCATDLIEMYKDLTESQRPTIYVGSFNYNGTNCEEIEEKVGSLIKLRINDFTLEAWDWNEFSKFFQCNETLHTTYPHRRQNFQNLVDLINRFGSNINESM